MRSLKQKLQRGLLFILILCCLPACTQLEPTRSGLSQVDQILDSHPCEPPDDGVRVGYHHPGNNIWLPDCDNPLQREYWRVFLESETSAYIIPRPDGASELQLVCGDESDPLQDLVDRYALCMTATSQADVEKVNRIAPHDALQVTHFLHTQLHFHVIEEGIGIAPFPIPSDILDACNLHPQANSTEFKMLCERERQRLEGGASIGFTYLGVGGQELVARLNELYGIEE